MAAIAELKALLGIDTSNYRAGMKGAEDVTRTFAREVNSAERQISNASHVAAGLGTIMHGNVARGLNQIVNGLDLVASKAKMAVMWLGSIAAAAGAGWMVGTKLDQMFNISGKIANAFVAPTEGGDQFGAQKRARKIDTERRKMEEERLTEPAKKKLQYERQVEEMTRRIRESGNDLERQANQKLLDDIKKFYAEDVEAAKEAARKKTALAVEAARAKTAEAQAQLDDTNDRFEQRKAEVMGAKYNLKGKDIRHDQMAAVGQMVGVSRSGVGTADRMLQKMIEDARRQEEIVRISKEQNDTLTDMKVKMVGL